MPDHDQQPVRWGVLGCADIATQKVIPGMAESPSSVVAAIASRSIDRAEATAAELGIAGAYGSYEELLADPSIEAVYIPLPNHLHREWAIAAVEAGKHVLCEKPLALTVADAREMVDAAERAQVLLMEAFMYRLHPMWEGVKRLVDGGRIGSLVAVDTVFSYHNVDPGDIRNQPEAGGGALYDIGCYGINVARFLFGSEPSVAGAVVRRDPRFGTDATTAAVLDFGGGTATLTVSTQAESSQRVEILGDRGRIVVPIPFNIPPGRDSVVHVVAGGDPPVAPATDTITFPATDQYGRQAELFAQAVRAGGPVPTPPADALANLAVIEAIFAAG
jgi:predicted dehydrogenase